MPVFVNKKMRMWGLGCPNHPLHVLFFSLRKDFLILGGIPTTLRTKYAKSPWGWLRFHNLVQSSSRDMSDFEEVFVLTSVVLQFPKKFLYCTCFSSPTHIPTRQESFDIWNLLAENRLTFNLFGFAVRSLLNFTLNPLLLRCLANLHVKTFISAP